MLLSDSLYALDKLGDTKLLVFAGAGMQSMFKTVQGFVFMLKLGAKPALEKAGDSAFMTGVKESLALFLHYVPGGAGAAAGSKANVKHIYGMPAAKARWDELATVWAKDKDAVVYADVNTLQAFSWLLLSDQQMELRKTGASIVAKTSGDVSVGPAKTPRKGAEAFDTKCMVASLFER